VENEGLEARHWLESRRGFKAGRVESWTGEDAMARGGGESSRRGDARGGGKARQCLVRRGTVSRQGEARFRSETREGLVAWRD
jgi:hypothetical protein